MKQLIEHIRKFIALDESEAAIVVSHFRNESFKKKALLVEEGIICNTQYFVLKGCVRLYIINEKGNEQTLQFAIENCWITDYMSLQNQRLTHFYIQAVEHSDVLAIDTNRLEGLLVRLPEMESLFDLYI